MFAYKEDCEIVRPDSKYDIMQPGCAVLMDCDGNKVFVVPEIWTDDQIWKCLEIVNFGYQQGEDAGANEKIREIKKVLLIN